MRLNWKVFYNVLMLRLTLGIGNFKSFHSLSAGHVPLGLGRDSGCLQEFKVRINVLERLEAQ